MIRWRRWTNAFLFLWFHFPTSDAEEDMSDVIVNTQTLALYDWFAATGMDKLDITWFSSASNLTEYDYCAFHGVTCDDEGYVTALDLNSSGLVGTIPDLRLLFRLGRLQASGNFLHGPLPDSLYQISSLQFVFLSENYLTGPLPDIPASSLLKRFLIARNALTGTIPASFCNAERLTTFDVSNNAGLRGTIPDCMESLSNLTRLRIDGTSLTGTIPAALCSVRDMNGLTPNTYGCDGVACAEGYYQRVLGRHYDSEPCQKCEVPSNVIGSTRCRWFEYSERNSSVAPSVSFHSTPVPFASPFTMPSVSPVPSTSTIAPSQPRALPSASPQSQDSNLSETGPRQGKAVIIATILVGLAFVGVLVSLIYRTVKRGRDSSDETSRSTSKVNSASADVLTSQTPEGAEILTKVSSSDGSASSNMARVDDGSAIAHALDSGAVRILNRAAGTDKRNSILRPASIGKMNAPEIHAVHVSQSHALRKVRFDIPSSLSYSQDSLDFLSSDSSIVAGEPIYSEKASRIIDQETWATWIMGGVFTECSPIDQPQDSSSNVSPPPQPSAPLLSTEVSPPKWERFDSPSSSRAFGACQMFPSCRPTPVVGVSSPKKQGASALAEAFRCGWAQEDDLNSVVAVPYGSSRKGQKPRGGVAPIVDAGEAEI